MIHAIIQYEHEGQLRRYADPMQFECAFEAQEFVDEMNRNYPFVHTWQKVDISVLTPKEAVTQLNALDVYDSEGSHREAEYILCRVMRTVGPEYAAVADAFNEARDRVGFWYA